MDGLAYLIIGVTIGYIVGGFVVGVRTTEAFKQILDDLGVTTEQLLKLQAKEQQKEDPLKPQYPNDRGLDVTLETIDGVIYAYRKDTGEFLAQDRDREALIKQLDLRFPEGVRINP